MKLLLGLGLWFFVATGLVQAQQLAGVVSWVEDGDSLTVLLPDGEKIKVRLHMVDAPEVCHRQRDRECRKPGQPFGEAAGHALARLVEGQPVHLRCVGKSYGRPVCDVWVGATNIAAELVFQGWAWYEPQATGRDNSLQAAQQAAQLARRGLWAGSAPIRPKDWRRACWEGGVC